MSHQKMDFKLIVELSAAIEQRLKEWFDVEPRLSMLHEPLGSLAQEVRQEIVQNLIPEHPLNPILLSVLASVVEHAVAIDKIGTGKAELLHVRHIEELFTITKFLVKQRDRWPEFGWRWKNFKMIHGLRNHVLNIQTPIEPSIQEWINANVQNVASYFNKKVTNDFVSTQSQWTKISNWLYPTTLKEIFAETGRSGSYESAEYDWNSQSVHFSPMANVVLDLSLQSHDYHDFACQSTTRFIIGFCREIYPLVIDQPRLRHFYAKQILKDLYRVVGTTPQHYNRLLNKDMPQLRHATVILLRQDTTRDQLIDSLIGELL